MSKKTKKPNETPQPPANREVRIMSPDDVELRVHDGDGDDGLRITGYAAKFGKWSADLGWFREKIRKGAFDEALKESDVRALKNHDINLLLGRTTSGTLRLDANSVGLHFECDVPNTTTGNDTVEEIKRGDLTGCSFAFTVVEDEWKYKEDDTVERTIVKIGQLFDVGPVTYPAYPDTTVAARSLDAFKAGSREDQESDQANTEHRTPNTESRTEDKPEEDKPIEETPEARARRRTIEVGYRKAGRILNRCRPADV